LKQIVQNQFEKVKNNKEIKGQKSGQQNTNKNSQYGQNRSNSSSALPNNDQNGSKS